MLAPAGQRPGNRSDLEEFPSSAGFRSGEVGAHSTRTIMLSDLSTLLHAVPSSAPAEQYRLAVLEQNVLGKRTLANRRHTIQALQDLYGLSPRLPLFRILRRLWDFAEPGRPVLAIQCARARDPILRVSSKAVLGLPVGAPLARTDLEDTIAHAWPGRFGPKTLLAITQRIGSSWTQSGHLTGRVRKVRTRALATPESTAYAVCLGYLCGVRGELLLQTLWASTLDRSPGELEQLAAEASRRGWIRFRRSGSVTDLDPTPLLAEATR